MGDSDSIRSTATDRSRGRSGPVIEPHRRRSKAGACSENHLLTRPYVPDVSEFAFELELCAALENERDGIVARQLGASVASGGGRILDIVHIEPGPAFDRRAEISPSAIPAAAIESDVGTGRARYWKSCFDCHPERARRAVERALEIGFFERERRGGRDYVRQTTRYPEWAGRVLAIENKPDLASPGDLEHQLRLDVSLGLVDEVVLATESYVTRAHLNRLPDPVGVWRIHSESIDLERSSRGENTSKGGVNSSESGPNGTDKRVSGIESVARRALEIEVIREPTPLPADGPGVEPVAYHPGRTDIAVLSGEEKARVRRRLLERAYGKGWRTYGFPACGRASTASLDGATVPYCPWLGRVVDAESDCGPTCAGFEALEGDGAEIDLEAERENRTAWVRDPRGTKRRQSGLDRFG